MTAFHDIVFPLTLAFGASGGPSRRVDIIPLASGGEARNTPHAQSRRRYNAAPGVKSLGDMQALIGFFEARLGSLHSFRFQDPFDYSADNQVLAIGDGAQTQFQLIKRYQDAGGDYVRPITKPRAGKISVFRDGQIVAETDYEVTLNTGLIIFQSAPDADVVVSASFEFDVPVRFDTEGLEVSLEASL